MKINLNNDKNVEDDDCFMFFSVLNFSNDLKFSLTFSSSSSSNLSNLFVVGLISWYPNKKQNIIVNKIEHIIKLDVKYQ